MQDFTIEILKRFNTNFKKLDLSKKKNNGFKKDVRIYGILNLEWFDNNLIEFNCSDNHIYSLENLPYKLTKLNCSNNQIVNLNNL